MKRGDVILVRESGSPASKARPCLVVQRSSTIVDGMTKITLCPLTSQIASDSALRPRVGAGDGTGLRETSAVEIDWIFTYQLKHVGRVIGSIDDDVMIAIDRALRRWLDL